MKKISADLENKIRTEAKNRCGYCLAPQVLIPLKLEIEHIYPISKGGTNKEENLWLSCRKCNSHKASKIYGFDPILSKRAKLFNPRKQNWADHFAWNLEKGLIIGKTVCGRATVNALKLNNEFLVTARVLWIKFGVFPPKD